LISELDVIVNNFNAFAWESVLIRIHALRAATEAARLGLCINEPNKDPKSGRPNLNVLTGRAAGRRNMTPRHHLKEEQINVSHYKRSK
jgi:hypothetical protein